MKCIRVATYDITKGNFQDIAEEAKLGMLPKFQDQPGFLRYGVADIGDRKLVSISLWETHDQAEHAVPVAADWVRGNMSDRVALRSNYVGDLAFFSGVPATV
jgi:hypothetical protein